MTSAIHGGVHNVSRRMVGVGCVGIISSIYELVALQNQVLRPDPFRQDPTLGSFHPTDGQCCSVPSLTQPPRASHFANGLTAVGSGDG